MTERDRKIGAENCKTFGDEQAQAKSSLDDRQKSSHLGRCLVNSYKAVAVVTLNTLIFLFACNWYLYLWTKSGKSLSP